MSLGLYELEIANPGSQNAQNNNKLRQTTQLGLIMQV